MREMVAGNLREAGYEVREAKDAAGAWKALRASRVDLVLLDWMLPGASGYEFLRRLRREGAPAEREVPVILVTARADEPDRVRGLDAGADDYVVKPFSPTRAPGPGARPAPQVRGRPRGSDRGRGPPHRPRELPCPRPRGRGGTRAHRISPPPLPGPSHPDRVWSRAQLLDNAWGHDVFIEERTVDVQIRRVRKALAPHGVDGYIQTVRGFGYRFSVAD